MKYLIIIFCLALFYCESSITKEKPKEIISILTLESGIQDTVYLDEIFFADKYNPHFKANSNIFAEYIDKTNQIILNPKDDFSGLTFIEFTNFDKKW